MNERLLLALHKITLNCVVARSENGRVAQREQETILSKDRQCFRGKQTVED